MTVKCSDSLISSSPGSNLPSKNPCVSKLTQIHSQTAAAEEEGLLHLQQVLGTDTSGLQEEMTKDLQWQKQGMQPERLISFFPPLRTFFLWPKNTSYILREMKRSALTVNSHIIIKSPLKIQEAKIFPFPSSCLEESLQVCGTGSRKRNKPVLCVSFIYVFTLIFPH